MPATPFKTHAYFYAEWAPGGVYHVYNRAVAKNELFTRSTDYFKFVERLQKHISPYCELFAYALVINHFHLMLRLPSEETLAATLNTRPELSKPEISWLGGATSYNALIGFLLGNCFKAYALSYNKRHDRHGTLLNQTVRRIRTVDDVVSRRLICYLHTQELKHGISDAYATIQNRSSFAQYSGAMRPTGLLTMAPVLERFGGLDIFLRSHERYTERYGAQIRSFRERRYFGKGLAKDAPQPFVDFLDDEESMMPGAPLWLG